MAEKPKENEITYVQVRLPKDVSDRLRADAERANRKLPSEIAHRLAHIVAGDSGADALLYGWVNPERNKLLGEALGILAGRLEVAGPMTDDRVRDRAAVLGMLKLAVGAVLDRLGADEKLLSEDEWNFASLEARKFANELCRQPGGAGSLRPDLEIMARVASGEPMRARKGQGG